jgi:hypothetical protein
MRRLGADAGTDHRDRADEELNDGNQTLKGSRTPDEPGPDRKGPDLSFAVGDQRDEK